MRCKRMRSWKSGRQSEGIGGLKANREVGSSPKNLGWFHTLAAFLTDFSQKPLPLKYPILRIPGKFSKANESCSQEQYQHVFKSTSYLMSKEEKCYIHVVVWQRRTHDHVLMTWGHLRQKLSWDFVFAF